MLLIALLVPVGCSTAIPGQAVPISSPDPATDSSSAPQLASTGPRIAAPKKAEQLTPSIADQQQVSSALGPVSGPPAALSGNANSCVWPLDSGSKNGFLVGYGVAYDELQLSHPAARGALERTTDGNSTWLWCDVSEQTGAFSCGAAVAISADRTFLTGLVRSPGAGRTKTSVLAELQSITIPLFRTLPGL